MPTVRTTMQPDRDLEVTPGEARDLSRQGLLTEDQPRQGQPSPTPPPSGDKPKTDK